jgi:hypothetical protein
MSDETQQEQAEAPKLPEHQTGYTGHEYPWMADPKTAKAERSARHLPPMLRRKPGGKAR